jgi:predicted O-methyltransferase YrrM
LARNGRNLSLFKEDLRKARSYFKGGALLQSLAILDRLTAEPHSATTLHLRALVRENISDLTGSITDLAGEELGLELTLARARVLSKLGFGEEAILSLREMLKGIGNRNRPFWASRAIGIAGRRFDLELLGVRPGAPDNLPGMSKWKQGCVVEHLVALGEFRTCKRLFGGEEHRKFSLMSMLNDIESADDVGRLVGAGLPPTRVQQAIGGIRGWLSLDEGTLLATLAARVQPQNDIVEVGSFLGRSTCALAAGSESGSSAKVHAVDMHSGLAGIFHGSTLPAFRANLASKGLASNVKVHEETSKRAARLWMGKRVGLLFVDAAHDYGSVRSDFVEWLPLLSPDAYVVFHDSNQPGPNVFLREIIRRRHDVHPLGLRDSLFVLQVSGSSSSTEEDSATKETWTKYLTILENNFSTWMLLQRAELNHLTLDLFNRTERSAVAPK